MQSKKKTILDFRRRTDLLAERLGVRLGALPEKLGISRASFFAYRSGKIALSNKALSKLQRAEREAGLAAPFAEQLANASDDEKSALIGSASLAELLELFPVPERAKLGTLVMEHKLDSTEWQLIGFLNDAIALAEMTKTRRANKDQKFFSDVVSDSAKRSRELVDFLLFVARSAYGLDQRPSRENLAKTKMQNRERESKPHQTKPSTLSH